MTDISLSVGEIVADKISGKEYRILWLRNDIGSLCEMGTSRLNIFMASVSEIIEKIMQGKAEVSIGDYSVIKFESLSDAAKKKYELYSKIFADIDSAFGPDYTSLSGRGRKPEIDRIIDTYHVPRSTLWNNIRLYLQSGRDICTLFANRYPKQRKPPRNGKKIGRKSFEGIPIDDKVIPHFEYALEMYKSGRAMTVKNAYTLMNLKYYCQDADGEVSTTALLPVSERPTLNQLRNYIRNHITQDELDAIKTSKMEQRNNKRLLLSNSLKGVNGPGDLVEIDAVEIDLSLVSSILPDQAIGRPIAYVMIDVYTRVVLAVSVAFDNNSYVGLSSLFLNLADDKVEFCKRYGVEPADAENWPSNCIPARIRVDRGADFKSKDFEQLCKHLNIQREIVPGGTGSLKGVVERFFHELHAEQGWLVEGHGRITKRFDSRHHKEATLTLFEYMQNFINIILRHNMHYMESYRLTADMRKQGASATPLSIWQYGIQKYGNPRPIVNKEQYRFDLMLERKASLSRRGILFNGLFYHNPDDRELYTEMYNAQNKRIPMLIRYDPRSVNNIYYLRDNKLMMATLSPIAGNIDYAGLSFAEWDLIRMDDAKRKKAGQELNDQLSADLAAIGLTVVNAASKKKKRYSNTKDILAARAIEKHITTQENRIKLLPMEPETKEVPKVSLTALPESQAEIEIPTGDDLDDFAKALRDFHEED